MRAARIRSALAALTCAAGLGLTGCADEESPLADVASNSASAPATAAAADAFPVTISQDVGDVTVESAPERVVALDFPSADAAIALGVVPIAMAELSYIPGGIQEWTMESLGGETPELIRTEQGFPFEAIAKLDPDVMLATNTFPLVEDSWSELNAIAPVVAHVDEPGLDDWQDGFVKVARALGRGADANVILGTTSDPDQSVLDELAESELFARVPTVARGSFLGFGIGPATAMAFPSVLSVQYALEELIDDFAAALNAGASPTPASS